MSITWSARIDRESVLHAIGVKGDKIPVDMDKRFEKVTIYHRDWKDNALRSRNEPRRNNFLFTRPQLVDVTLIVRPLKRFFVTTYDGKQRIAKSSKHRTFLICPRCACEIPTGRFHQHINTKVCNEGYDKQLDKALAEIDLNPATNEQTIALLND